VLRQRLEAERRYGKPLNLTSRNRFRGNDKADASTGPASSKQPAPKYAAEGRSDMLTACPPSRGATSYCLTSTTPNTRSMAPTIRFAPAG
jgi:hypothetical protein